MPAISRRPIVSVAVLALTLGAAAACGSSSSGGDNGQSVTPQTGVNAAAAKLVPAAIKSKGTLVVAADASYAPNEFLSSDQKTVIGMDPDLAVAIGKELGLKIQVKNITFDSIITGLVSGKYDLGMSSFTDNKVREQQVNFVTYFSAGTSFFEKKGDPVVDSLAQLCGKKVAVESGTTQESDSKAESKKCPSGSIDVEAFPTQSAANLALNSGRADVSMADSPVAAYQVKQSNGAFQLSPTSYGAAPYGIAVPKSDGTLDQAVLAALKDLIANGTYTRIMSHWGIQAGAITNPVINGAVS
jgi:polar amino acid transport system substrate-binding protein